LRAKPQADALHLRRVQRVQLVLVVTLLRADALGALQPHLQLGQRQWVVAGELRRRPLALHLAHDHAQDRALALEHGLQALELLGMRVATGLAPQRLAFLGKGLLEHDAGPPRGTDDLVARNLQQSAVHRMRNGLFLHRGVHDHALELTRVHRLDHHGRVDGGLEQLLQALFAQFPAAAPDLRGVAGQAVLVVGLAAEELPQHVLAPAHADLLVAEVEAVLEVQQAAHQPDWQPRSAGIAAAHAHQLCPGAQQVHAFDHPAGSIIVFEPGRQRLLDLRPGQAHSQHRQWIPQIDHRVNPAAEEVRCLHRKSPRNQMSVGLIAGEVTIRVDPESSAFMRVPGLLQGRLRIAS
jgi:hypothetical protein